jgi:hypothetical protein
MADIFYQKIIKLLAILKEFIKANLSHLLETDLCIKGRMKTAADSVITDLKSITDDAFALDFCLNALFADYKSAHQILQFAVLRIYEINKRINESSASSVAIDFVFKMLKRLATFRSISGGDYCSDEWHRFRSCNLMKELSNWAAKSRMDNVITIWRRHSQGRVLQNFISFFKNPTDEPFIDSINDLLYHLPPNLSLDDYFEWIRDDILPVISHNSEMYTTCNITNLN